MFFFNVCFLVFVTPKLSSLSSIWFQVSFLFACIHWWCSASKWVNPSLPHIPPTILFSPIRSPLPLFPVCICISIETHTAHVLTMCCRSLLPVHSLLPLFLTHFSVMHPFSVLHSCCKMTPPPSSHTRALSLGFLSYHAGLIFFFPHTVMVLVGLYAMAGHGVAKAAHMYYWAPVFIGWYGQTLWCCKGYCPEMPNQRLLLCGQACITYIHLYIVHRHTTET